MKSLLVFLVLCSTSLGDERHEVERIAEKYNLRYEVTLSDRTRVDLVSMHYAIEVDWAAKWAEAIGQSLFYAEMTGRKPGIVLIRKSDMTLLTFNRYATRCLLVCRKYNIRCWTSDEGYATVTELSSPSPFEEVIQ